MVAGICLAYLSSSCIPRGKEDESDTKGGAKEDLFSTSTSLAGLSWCYHLCFVSAILGRRGRARYRGVKGEPLPGAPNDAEARTHAPQAAGGAYSHRPRTEQGINTSLHMQIDICIGR